MANRAAQTALGPMVIVAVDQYEQHPLIQDELARRILPARMRAFTALTRWGPMRRWMVRGMEKQVPGMWASFLCRKRYIDDRLLEAMDEIDALAILGAGFDTRAYRLSALANVAVFEVDLPENVERKRALVRRLYDDVPAHVTLVPVDFESQRLEDRLAEHGYDSAGRTFFVLEAVTQYLTEKGIRSTFSFLSKAQPGSRLVFTHLPRTFLDGKERYGAEALHKQYVVKRRLWHFGLDPDQVPGFLGEFGWQVVEQPTGAELADRYVRPTGRELPVSEVERSVYAEKVRAARPLSLSGQARGDRR